MENVKNTSWKTALIVGGVVVLFLFLIGLGSNSGNTGNSSSVSINDTEVSVCDVPPAKLSQEVVKVDYKQLEKDPESFKGTITSFTGQVLQIQQSGDFGFIRLSVTKDSYGWNVGDVVMVRYHQVTPAVKDDIVDVTGIITGAITYTSQANYEITVPGMDVCSVEVKTKS